MIFSARCAVGVDAASRRRREATREVWLSKPYLLALRGDQIVGIFETLNARERETDDDETVFTRLQTPR